MNYLNNFFNSKKRIIGICFLVAVFSLFFIALFFYQQAEAKSKTLNLVIGKYECTKNADCVAENTYCDIDTHTCKSQIQDSACEICEPTPEYETGEPLPECEICAPEVTCESGTHKLNDTCVQCINDADCPMGICDTETHTCSGCHTQNDCTTNAPICDTETHTCHSCESDEECPEVCDNGKCVLCVSQSDTKPYYNPETKECERCPLNKPIYSYKEKQCTTCYEIDSTRPVWSEKKGACTTCSSSQFYDVETNSCKYVSCTTNAECLSISGATSVEESPYYCKITTYTRTGFCESTTPADYGPPSNGRFGGSCVLKEELDGRTMTLKGVEKMIYISNVGLNYWSAENLCASYGKKLVSGADLMCATTVKPGAAVSAHLCCAKNNTNKNKTLCTDDRATHSEFLKEIYRVFPKLTASLWTSEKYFANTTTSCMHFTLWPSEGTTSRATNMVLARAMCKD